MKSNLALCLFCVAWLAIDRPAFAQHVEAPDGGAAPDPFAQAEESLADPPSEVDGGVTVIAPEESLFQVEGIDIVATPGRAAKEAPSSAYSLDAAELERFNFDDPNQVLARVPGVYVRKEDGYGLRPNIGMRGADADRSKKITLMEDGVLFGPAPYSAPAAYYFPLMTRMVGVDVWKGVSAIRYGPQTIGGALDLRTRQVPERGVRAGLDASLGNTYFAKIHGHGGYGSERWGLLTEGVHLSSQGFKKLDGGGDTGFSKQELMLKGRVNSDPDARVYHKLEPKLGYSREDSNETYLGLSDADFRASPLRRYAASRLDGFSSRRMQFELGHTLGIGEHFELRSVAYRHDYTRLWNRLDSLVPETLGAASGGLPGLKTLTESPEGYAPYFELLTGEGDSGRAGANLLLAGNRRTFVAQGVQSVARIDFKGVRFSHSTEVGVRLHYDRIRRRHSANGYALANGVFARDGQTLPLLAHNEVETLAFAAHVTSDLTFSNLTLSPGVRAEIIRARYLERLGDGGQRVRFDPNVVLFALGARYALTQELSLLAGVQQGMTPVAPFIGRANGVPVVPKVGRAGQVERSVNYEFGGRYAGALAEGALVGFLSDYDRVVSPCEEQCTSDSSDSFTSGKALVYGVEFQASGRATLPRGFGLPVSASYTFTHAEFREAFESDYPLWGSVQRGDAMPYIAPHQFSLGAGFDYQRKFGIDLSMSFMDRMREQAGHGALQTGEYTDRYALLDLAGFYQLFDDLRLYVKVDNLTNNQPLVSRRPFGARPNQPLLAQAGVKWEL